MKNWNEITIRKWKELVAIDNPTELGVLIERTAIIYDCDPQDLRDLQPWEFNKLTAELDFISEPIPNEIKLRFEIDGVRYGFIPDLNYITTGEFVDLDELQKDTEKNIHLMAAILWRPIIDEDDDDWFIESHTTKGFQKRADLFLEKLPITHIWGAVLFFSSFVITSSEIIAEYFGQISQE